jgi:transposase
MPRPRSAMRKIREVLRLSQGEGLSRRQVARAAGVPPTTVADYLGRIAAAGLSWPLPDDVDDADLERRLFTRGDFPPQSQRPMPDWAAVHRELRRPSVTLQLLWMEHKEAHPDGHQYTQFVHHYREWARHLDLVLRQEHRAGEKLFLDFAGETIAVVDPETGVEDPWELFVGVLGASDYTYAEALPSQQLPQWIAAHVRCFQFLGGCPKILVPDNLRSAVTQAHRYEPLLNRTYEEMATHYGCAVIPARPRKPRDKAKAEQGVLMVERWILATLRHQTFFSGVALNDAIRERLQRLNDRPFKKLDGCRRSLFEELDKPVLRPLPERPYEYGIWKRGKVNIDYHVEVDRHYYSVPYQLVGQLYEARLTASTVEMFVRGRRVASHPRSFRRGGFTTVAEHMPASHRRHLEWTPSRIERWAEQTGPQTAVLAAGILRSRPHPEQGFRSCLGVLRLGKRYGPERLEAACARAVAIGAFSYRSVDSILRTGLDRQPAFPRPSSNGHGHHANVRGPAYYQ